MSEKIIDKGKRFINMETQIQITGNREVLVECCKKILEYNDVFIKVRTWDMTVQIWGSGLQVNDFNSNGIYVYGNIQSVELMKNG
ncbi:YabP/YqfC family sporulation protein [Porcipelethomonas sp.]|uniref:YabP/YqfC family sporulation protein n=1 Tax=Porcipelethomonas sp. TaxID=2981675 RepID=UPI003EF111BD